MWTWVNAWIKLHTPIVSSLQNFERTWLACKNKYKIILIEYENDKISNKFLGHDKHKCQYYKRIDMWNGQHKSVVNQMRASAHDDHQESNKDTQQNSHDGSPLANNIKDKKNSKQDGQI